MGIFEQNITIEMDNICLKSLEHDFYQQLGAMYDKVEIRNFMLMLAEHFMGYSKVDVLLRADDKLQADVCSRFQESLEKLKLGMPIQYVIGKAFFGDMQFIVEDGVLIPRPETEELVEWIRSDYEMNEAEGSILDIGTGSGCIALSLKKYFPKWNVKACDISSDALKIAKQNASLNSLDVDFLKLDILKTEQIDGNCFDVIVSNPPYVLESEKSLMHSNVLSFEPYGALFVDDSDPLIFYDKICNFCQRSLKDKGSLYFEINESCGDEMIALLEKYNFTDIELRKDLFGKDRMIKGVLLK